MVSLGKPVCLLPFLLVLLFTTLATRARPEACDSDKAEYDVCVVGCGGSGAFIATKLKKMGYSVLVLEKQDRCGGHCKTVKLPVPLPGGGTMQAPVDTGVLVYQNTSIVRETFQEWDVPLEPYVVDSAAGSTYFFAVNSPAYQTLPSPTLEQFTAFGAAVTKWNTMYITYFAALLTDNSALPDFAALPAATRSVLFGSFGQLLGWLAAQNPAEYGNPQWWQPLFPLWVDLVNNGPGPVLEATALTVLKTLQPSIMDIIVNNGGLRARGGCQTLYDKFASYLGDALKLNADFIATRGRGLVKVTYKQPGLASSVLTSCRRMVVSSVQSLDNMKAFLKDIDATERAAFESVTYSLYTYAIFNSIASDPTNMFSIKVPGLTNKDLPTTVHLWQILPTHARAHHVNLSPDDNAQLALERMYANATRWSQALVSTMKGFTLPSTLSAALAVGPEEHQYDPRAKVATDTPLVYSKLYGLQGYRNVYYTGALYTGLNSQSAVWSYSKWLVDTFFTGPNVWKRC